MRRPPMWPDGCAYPGIFSVWGHTDNDLDAIPFFQESVKWFLKIETFEPLGSNQPIGTNARIIVATHHNLEELVKRGTFREDLYYRINVVKLSLPPLADRKEDIPVLVDHFIERLNRLTGKTLREYPNEPSPH